MCKGNTSSINSQQSGEIFERHDAPLSCPSADCQVVIAKTNPSEQRDLDPSLSPETRFLIRNIVYEPLDQVDGWFWMVGSKYNINALHHQRVLLREIIPTDQARLHLVWFGRIIYIKPLPDYFLDYDFVGDHVLPHAGLKSTVVGFLRTYCDLIQSPIDIRVAHELGLLSKEVDWTAWFRYRESILRNTEEDDSTRRYKFGELRLSRLNIIWRLKFRQSVYFTVHREYDTYFQQYFSLFIAAFAIVATILTAMQVLVGIDQVPKTVTNVSYWFAIVAMVMILVCLAPVVLLFSVMFLGNVGIALWKKLNRG